MPVSTKRSAEATSVAASYATKLLPICLGLLAFSPDFVGVLEKAHDLFCAVLDIGALVLTVRAYEMKVFEHVNDLYMRASVVHDLL